MAQLGEREKQVSLVASDTADVWMWCWWWLDLWLLHKATSHSDAWATTVHSEPSGAALTLAVAPPAAELWAAVILRVFSEAAPGSGFVLSSSQWADGRAVVRGTRVTVAKSAVFWDVTPCGSRKNQRFGGMYRLQLLVTAYIVPTSLIFSTLMIGVLCTSEMSVRTRVTEHNIPESAIQHSHRRENLKSYKW
jgi:hypothetical protein